METQKSSAFPADVIVALMLPAIAIFALLFGPQRTWIILLLVGIFEFAAAFSVLRRSKSPVLGWLAVGLGLLALAAGIRFALIPW